MDKITEFWGKHKDTIKNVIIGVSVPLAVIALMGIRNLNQTIDEHDLNELFYGDPDEESEDFDKELENLIELENLEEA
jgi:hypothetical protein